MTTTTANTIFASTKQISGCLLIQLTGRTPNFSNGTQILFSKAREAKRKLMVSRRTRDAAALLHEIRGDVRSWLALWRVPELEGRLRIEWSWRLRRSLGRAFPQRSLVRLSPLLLDSPRELFAEAVCHEVAHVVAPLLRGSGRPHGPAWHELVRAAGFVPRIRIPIVRVSR